MTNASLYIAASRLIDGTGGVMADPVIEIRDGAIASVAPRAEAHLPGDAKVVDAGPCTVMPGLIDTHVHLAAFNCLTFQNFRIATFEVTPQLQMFYTLFHAQMCLEMGYTTLRDMGRGTPRGGYTAELCAVRDAIDAGIVPGPRLLVSGRTMITGSHFDLLTLPRAAERAPGFTADGPWALRGLAREHLRTGCDVIKTCVSGGISPGSTDDVRNMTQAELDAIVDEAHAFHKPVAVHCFTADAQRMCVKAGADTIEHMVYTDDDAVARIVDAGIYVMPTLLHRSDHAIDLREKHGAPASQVRRMREIQPHCFETFQRMREAGVRIAMGTDTTIDPEMGSNSRELELYVKLGMRPMDAILAATRDAADAIGLGTRTGTIEPGKQADLLAVEGDPAADVTVLQDRSRIKLVMKQGEIYVDKLSGHPRYVMHPAPGQWKIVDAE